MKDGTVFFMFRYYCSKNAFAAANACADGGVSYRVLGEQ